MSVQVPDFVRGKDLALFYMLNGQYYAIAHSTDCKLSVTTETQETTTKNTLRGKTFDFTGKYSFTLSLTGITNFLDVPNIVVVQQLIMTGTKIQFVFTDQYAVQYSGVVLITTSQIDSPYAALSTFSNDLQGDGELGITTTDVPPIPLPSENVTIIDQFGNVVAVVVAPGSYSVIRFDTIDEGHAVKPASNLIIIEGQ